jgi:diketogulonate reductase-like aldo/keto reductase
VHPAVGRSAIESGYRHIDTAAFYANEGDVGRAVRDSGVAREQIFVTTKLASMGGTPYDYDATLQALEESLRLLGFDYVDLFLIHSPNDKKNRLHQWRALEKAKELGLVKSIGVSNYGIHHLEELMRTANVLPATNQIELHPWLTRTDLVSYCTQKGIVLTAYSPLAKARKMSEPALLKLAAKYGCSGAQLLIRWCLQRGYVTIPKSTKPSRIAENRNVDVFEIEETDMVVMDSWNRDFVTGWDPTKSP